ncbi:MAG: TlpA disulfide reductase family protein [Gammaproteobacteria bacterium]|nr:TlpA disulfide reductase family protein [Gammaproteobacteria bacterium]
MKLLRILLWFWASLCCAVGVCATQQFTVNGEISSDTKFLSSATEESPAPIPEDMDWSAVRVVVTHTAVNSDGGNEIVELASGHLKNGSITLTGEIAEPIDAQISIYSVDKRLSTLDVLISPGSSVSFVIIEENAHLELFGVARYVRDPSKKFTIYSDFSFDEGDLDGAVARIIAQEHDASGKRSVVFLTKVALDKGKFVLEAEVDEPRVVNILVAAPHMYYDQVNAVIEPGAEIRVSSIGTSSLKGMFATSSEGKHAQLIDAWHQSEEYLSIFHSFVKAYEDYQGRMKVDAEISIEEVSNEGSNANVVHTTKQETPSYLDLSRKMQRLKYDFLDKISSHTQDPMTALLALELGAHRDVEEALPIYDRLVRSLDYDLVLRRVVHRRNQHARSLARSGNDKSLTIGEQAPNFVLPSINGKETELFDLLSRQDFVLVDFWASWCAPCVATFPALRKLHAAYSNHGFEIVSVSIDDNKEIWSEGTEQYEPTWVNLGELKGFEGEVVTSYGVDVVPKGYLLDSQGHIVQKDLSTDQLADFLAEEYGEAEKEIVP